MDALDEDVPSLTEQLQRFSDGDRAIAEEVLRQVLPELHRIAERTLRYEHDSSFSPTELLNEIWIRKLRQGGFEVNNRQHFYAVASLAMRQVLIESARRRKAERRGGSQPILPLYGNEAGAAIGSADFDTVIQIGILMEGLDRRNPESARIVDMHYFAGFTLDEIVDISGLTLRQVRHRWAFGRDWLKDGLRRPMHKD